MKIKVQFIISLFASAVIPVVCVSLIAIYDIRESVKESFKQSSVGEIRQIDNAFTTFFNVLGEHVTYLSKTSTIQAIDSNFYSYIGRPKTAKMTPLQNSFIEAEVYRLFTAYGADRPDIAYIYLGTSKGGYTQWPAGGRPANFDPRVRPWYKLSMANPGKAVLGKAYQGLSDASTFINYMVTFKGQDDVTGVLAIDVTLNKLTEMLKQVKFGESGYVMMIEETGTVLADPSTPENNFKQLSELGDVYEKLANVDSGIVSVTINGTPMYASVYVSPVLKWKFIGFIPLSEVYETSDNLTIKTIFINIVLVLIFMILGWIISSLITRPMQEMTEELENISSGEGDLTKRIDIQSANEVGLMAGAFNKFIGTINDLINQIKDSSLRVDEVSTETNSVSNQIQTISENQSTAIEQVATAFNEMVATSKEVANNCTLAANAADEGRTQASQGNAFIEETVQSVQTLEKIIGESNDAMNHLAGQSQNITTILDTIRGIAEQTNLLALNAAIEAARAGEQGRGFAVVADEVRTLAGRTSESTEEIDNLLNSLKEQTITVSEKLGSSLEHSKQSVDTTQKTKSVFESIQTSVGTIRDMTTQIASAAEEQRDVAEGINQSIIAVHDEATKANNASENSKENAERLKELAERLTALVGRFKTSS